MVKVIIVKFKNGGKPYYFAPGNEKYEKGMGVIVETAKGLEYATVVAPEGEVADDEIVAPLKPVVRIATPRDEEQVKRNRERRGEALKTAQEKIAARGLEMKLVDCEFAFDGSKVVFYFTAESRVDFRELIKDLSSAFHMRIELRQISIRDEIKITGGLAPCGRECCCIGSMPEPLKVSVKMAKNQGLSLNPQKISGLCGRLMCCLAYENEYYAEACKQVPKIGSEAETPDGKGTVVNVNMLKMLVKVKIEQGEAVSYHEYAVDQIRFKRGNVVMGKEDLDSEDESGAEAIEQTEAAPVEEAVGGEPARHDKRRNEDKGRRGRRGNDNRGENGERRERVKEGNRQNFNGKQKNNRNNNQNGNQNNNQGGNRNNGQNNNQHGGQGNPNPQNNGNAQGGRNRRHRHNGRRPEGNGGGNGDKPNN